MYKFVSDERIVQVSGNPDDFWVLKDLLKTRISLTPGTVSTVEKLNNTQERIVKRFIEMIEDNI